MKGNSEAVERTGKRVPCPVCGGSKRAPGLTSDTPGVEYTYVDEPCAVCDGVGEVVVCPVCEGKEALTMPGKPCPTCKSKGYVKISEWNAAAVDAGHRKLMGEHRAEQEGKAAQEEDGAVRLVVVHRMAMNTVMQEWERFCRKNLMHTVDAGAFASVLGGMTVEHIKSMEEEMKIGRHQVFARFVNGMLEYMETRGDTEGIGIVAGQSGECYSSVVAMGAAVNVKKEEMN